MDEKSVFVLADQTLQKVIDQIQAEQWDMVMPPSFQMRTMSEPPTLRTVINYHAYDDAWVPDMLAGFTMEEAGKEKFDGDLLGEDPKGNFAKIVAHACEAATNLDDLQKTVHCSFGDYTAQQYLRQINSFRGLRANDLALVLGIDPTLPDSLVQGLWEELSPHAEEWRAIGVFGPKVEVAEDASLQDKLLGLTGREPNNF